MALKITSKKGTATVSKQMKYGPTVVSDESTQEEVAAPGDGSDFASGQLCEVGVNMSYTHNLGNYSSAKLGVSLKIPCPHSEIDAVYAYAKEWVDTKMMSLIKEINSKD